MYLKTFIMLICLLRMRVSIISFCYFLIFGFSTSANAQSLEEYEHRINIAKSLLEKYNYKEAGYYYSTAFAIHKNKGRINDHYHAARAWAMAGSIDSAYLELDELRKRNYPEYLKISTDTAFLPLRNNPGWTVLLAKIKINKQKTDSLINSTLPKANFTLIKLLDTIFFDDQFPRLQMDEVVKLYGMSSPQMKLHYAKTAGTDSINLLRINKMIKNHGWPKKDEVGDQGISTVFLVIQHADLTTQIHYLPRLKAASKRGDLAPSRLAVLEDRIARRQGKSQKYGTQLMMNNKTGKYYLQPVEDPINLDRRRKSVGLPPIKEYVKQWGIIWSLEQYYQDLKDAY